MRPSARSICSLKLCAPNDSRLTPACWNPARSPRSTVPGLASIVISQSAATSNSCFAASRIRPMSAGWNRLGVPPPRKILPIGLPAARSPSSAISARSAATYRTRGALSPATWELKSQYGHLRTHQGRWMYSDNGGTLIITGLASAGMATTVAFRFSLLQLLTLQQAIFQLAECLAAMTHTVFFVPRHLRSSHA